MNPIPFLKSKIGIIAISVSSVIFIIGVLFTIHTVKKTTGLVRDSLLLRTQNAALLLDAQKIAMLSGAPQDLTRSEYIDIKNNLAGLRELNTDTRFFYLFGKENDTLFFYADSESPMSSEYSPPGQIYYETTQEQLHNYTNSIPYVEGPYPDRWGVWVTAFAPVIDPQTGAMVAMLGTDIDATLYNKIKWGAIMTGSLMTILLSSIMMLFALYMRKSSKYISLLSLNNKDLTITKHQYEKIHSMMGLGSFRYIPTTGFMYWNEFLYDLFEMPRTGMRITLGTLLDLIDDPEERKEVKESLEYLVTPEGGDSLTFAVGCKLKDGTRIPIIIHAILEKDDAGNIIAVNGSVSKGENIISQ